MLMAGRARSCLTLSLFRCSASLGHWTTLYPRLNDLLNKTGKMAPHRSSSRPPTASPGPLPSLVAPPSGPHLKRRRKGVPCKAPTPSSPTTTAATATHSNQVNVNLLLRALLREGQGGRGLVNKRHVAPVAAGAAAGPGKKKKERQERDQLPPAPAGYGRGKRSLSAALGAGEHQQQQQQQEQEQTRGREMSRAAAVDKNSLQVPSTTRRPPRSASTEPISPSSLRSFSASSSSSAAAPAAVKHSLAPSPSRASSAGPPSSRIAPPFHPYGTSGLRSPGTSHQAPPVCPSPLATSLPWTRGEEEKVEPVAKQSPSVKSEETTPSG